MQLMQRVPKIENVFKSTFSIRCTIVVLVIKCVETWVCAQVCRHLSSPNEAYALSG